MRKFSHQPKTRMWVFHLAVKKQDNNQMKRAMENLLAHRRMIIGEFHMAIKNKQ